jgi:hypothetical protein
LLLPAKVEQTFGLRSRMMALLDGHVPGMKELYNAFRFLVACVIIFGSGYLLAKPHNGADKLFAPLLCVIAVY